MSERLRTILMLAPVLAIALVLRLGQLDLVQFGSDQARVSFLAVDMATSGRVAPVSDYNSLGLRLPPGSIWMLAPAAALSPHPLWLTAYVGVLNVLGIALLFFFGSAAANRATGLVAALLLACGTWAVQYSRSVWVPDLIVPVVCAVAATFWLAIKRQRPVWLAVSAGLLGLLVQIHPSTLAFAVAWAVAVAVGVRGRLLPGVAIGAVIVVVGLIPFARYEARHGWRDVRPPPQTRPLQLRADGLYWSGALLTSRGFAAYYLGSEAPQASRETPALDVASRAAGWLVTAALVLGSLAFAARARRRWKERADRAVDVLMAGWLVLPMAAASFNLVEIQPHYLLVSLPAQALLAAWGLTWLWPATRAGRACGGALVACVCLVQVWYFTSFNAYLERVPFRGDGDYRITYRCLRERCGELVARQGDAGRRQLEQFEWGRYLVRYDIR